MRRNAIAAAFALTVLSVFAVLLLRKAAVYRSEGHLLLGAVDPGLPSGYHPASASEIRKHTNSAAFGTSAWHGVGFRPFTMSNLSFPEDFMWGTATASYQIEGAAAEDGRSPSIWDVFAKTSKHMKVQADGDVACDHYHRFRDDVKLIKQLGARYYRFSIAWPRLYPNGVLGGANAKGIAFYSALVDELLANNITPVATLYHWDLPTSVEKSTHGGWIGDGSIADEFAAYARLCFEQFGDRVKWWITLNEPWCSAFLGYAVGEHAPGKTDAPGVDPYLAAHNLLRSHGKAVRIYREEFAARQRGKIGITLNSNWGEPVDASDNAKAAAKRFLDFNLGWFADPIYKGDYPASMREAAGDRLPVLTNEEKAELLGSSDFFGLNHYSTHTIVGLAAPSRAPPSVHTDLGIIQRDDPSLSKTDMGWAVAPFGFRKLLAHIQREYRPAGGIIVTENGLAAYEPTLEAAVADHTRIPFYYHYVREMHKAVVEDGADVRGYFLWSLMDNFEWSFGYEKRFGLYYVNYTTLERMAKPAATWYAEVVLANGIPEEPVVV
jgi:beta-galactosidase